MLYSALDHGTNSFQNIMPEFLDAHEKGMVIGDSLTAMGGVYFYLETALYGSQNSVI